MFDFVDFFIAACLCVIVGTFLGNYFGDQATLVDCAIKQEAKMVGGGTIECLVKKEAK